MKRLVMQINVFLVLVILLAACAPAASPQPTKETADDTVQIVTTKPINTPTPSPEATPDPDELQVQEAMWSLSGSSLKAIFDYRMHDRFGLDADGNNIPDLPNTWEYVQNLGRFASDSCQSVVRSDPGSNLPAFAVTFDASQSDFFAKPLQIDQYLWEISGQDIHDITFNGRTWCVELPEGSYEVTLTVVSEEESDTVVRTVVVEDLLIVSIGDSFSSGEGNPERPTEWASPGARDTTVAQEHIIAHRSTLAWAAQAALALERADPHTSVTFVSVAATGATIAKGLLAEHPGAKVEEGKDYLPDMASQIVQVHDLVGNRSIDALTMSIGVNDIGFRQVLTALIFKGSTLSSTYPPEITEDQIRTALQTGHWEFLKDKSAVQWLIRFVDKDSAPDWGQVAGFDGLLSEFQRLNDDITNKLPNVRNIYVIEYPDPTSRNNDQGSRIWCPQMMAYLNAKAKAVNAKLDADEVQWARREVLVPLNQKVREAAQAHGWIYLSGVSNAFGNGGHGYCAIPPYKPTNYVGNPYPSAVPYPIIPGVRWFRTAGAAADIQEPAFVDRDDAKTDTLGTMHPNELGHRVAAEFLLAYLDLPVDIPGVGYGVDPTTMLPRGSPPERNESGVTLGLSPEYGGWISKLDVAGTVWGTSVKVGALFAAGSPLGPYFEIGNEALGISTSASLTGAGVQVGRFEALIDPSTGALLAIKTGDQWFDIAGNLLAGNPFETLKALLSDPKEKPKQAYVFVTSDDCPWRNEAVAKAHQAELDENDAWLQAHGYVKTDHHYSSDQCYPLKEWQPGPQDSDGDGLSDYFEQNYYKLDPDNPDIDGDGLLDGREVEIGTWYANPDSDSDGVPDKVEDDWWQSLSAETRAQLVSGLGCATYSYGRWTEHAGTCYRLMPPAW